MRLAWLGVGDGEVIADRAVPAGAGDEEVRLHRPDVLRVVNVLHQDVTDGTFGMPVAGRVVELVHRGTGLVRGVDHAFGYDADDARDLVLGVAAPGAVDAGLSGNDRVGGAAVGLGEGQGGSSLGEWGIDLHGRSFQGAVDDLKGESQRETYFIMFMIFCQVNIIFCLYEDL